MGAADPDRFREPFSRSLPYRDAQHQQTEAYLAGLWSAAPALRRAGHHGRRRLASMIGYPPPGAIRPRVLRQERVGKARSYTVTRMWIEVARGLEAYGIYLAPRTPAARVPLVVAIHGGSGCPEAICDLDTRENYHSFGPAAAEAGWAVWAPALLMTVGYGGDPPRARDRYYLDRKARLVGSSIVAIEVQRILASLAALRRERPEIDPGRVSMAGLSYGGYFTLLCAALAPSVRAAVCSGYFGSFTDRFGADVGTPGRGEDVRFPGLLCAFEMADLAALICPRPLMIQNGLMDEVVPAAEARREAGRAAAHYRRRRLEERLVYAEHRGGHVLDTEAVLEFLRVRG